MLSLDWSAMFLYRPIPGIEKTPVIKYSVSTKELYTFKIIQKTNAAYVELHIYTIP
jgi:hypothetical protein